MLIKRIDAKGRAVPMTPEEALYAALVSGCKNKSDSEWVLWAQKDGIKLDSPVSHHTDTITGNWEATAKGTCLIGKTKVFSDKFYDPKKCTFSVSYKNTKDEIGLPDIEVTAFTFSPIETNPAKQAGAIQVDNSTAAPLVVGELIPEPTGR